MIFYAVRSPKLTHWLHSDLIQEHLVALQDSQYLDEDPTFYQNIDEDYDLRHGGISKASFLNCYLGWIQYCASRRNPVSLIFSSLCVTQFIRSHNVCCIWQLRKGCLCLFGRVFVVVSCVQTSPISFGPSATKKIGNGCTQAIIVGAYIWNFMV